MAAEVLIDAHTHTQPTVAAGRAFGGQWGYAREPSDEELSVTTVLVLDLDEASVKVRSGPPGDGAGPDADRPVWAGEIPLRTVRLDPVPDPAGRAAVGLPAHLARPGVARRTPLRGDGT